MDMGSRNINPCILEKQDLLPLCLHFTPSTLGFAWVISDYPLAHANPSGQFCLWIPDLLVVCALVVQLLSHVRPSEAPWTAARQASLSSTVSWSLLKFMAIESVMLSNHRILCCPLLLFPSIFPNIRVSNETALCIR